MLVGVDRYDGARSCCRKLLAADDAAPPQAAGIGAALASMLIYIVMALDPGLPAEGPVRGAEADDAARNHASTSLPGPAAAWRCRWRRQLLDEPFYVTLATRIAILALAAVGLNLALGFGGLVSFGHAAFFGIGGYAAGILASHAFNAEPLCLGHCPAARPDAGHLARRRSLVCGLVALPIGAVSLRTSGVYFIMITLAFAQMIYYFAISWPAYGGEDGLSITVRNSFPGVEHRQSHCASS